MTYKEIKRLMEGRSLPVLAKNQDEEPVIIEEGRSEAGHFYRLTTAQNNNWCRINVYYEDGSTDEIYQKD
nr:hypothetical protein [uncultured Dysosmobacter sp.]